MPGVSLLRSKATGISTRTVKAEHLPLYLPSALMGMAEIMLSPALQSIELRLRYAQANDALEQMRRHLHVRTRLYNVKDRDVRGQQYNMRARTYINTVQDRISADVACYCLARQALLVLDPGDKEKWQRTLHPLEPTDIQSMKERLDNETEDTWRLPWIWRTAGFSGVDDEDEDELEGAYATLLLRSQSSHAVYSLTDRVVQGACSST